MALAARSAGALLAMLGAVTPAAAAAPDPAFLRQQWQAQANAGDPQAAYRLGLMYDLGQGVAPDAATALGWYRRAGAEGVADAAFNAAVMLDDGQSVGRDRPQAAAWYARSAVHGNARAAFNLARMYQAGDGVPHNDAAALAWLEVAAPHVPIARQRLHVLRSQLATASKTTSPDAIPPAAQPLGNAGQHPSELVWTAPDTAGLPVRYVVSLAVPGARAWTQVREQVTELTAMLAPQTGCYAWRVYSVLPGGARYSASEWQRIGCKI